MKNFSNQLPRDNKINIYVSASYLKNTACWRKYFFSAVEALALKSISSKSSAAYNYGTAMGMFLDRYHCGMAFDLASAQAVEWLSKHEENLPADEYRDSNHLRCCVSLYAKQIPASFYTVLRDSEGEHRVQETFFITWWENSQYRIILCGTLDKLVEYAGHPAVILDDKTSGARKDSFFQQYEHGIQPMFYSYCEHMLSGRREYLPFLVNAVLVKKPTLKAAKEGRGWDGAEFCRSPLYEFSEPNMEEFRFWLHGKLSILQSKLECAGLNGVSAAFEEDFDLATCYPQGYVNPCPYTSICRVGTAVERKTVKDFMYNSGYESPTIKSLLEK